MFRVNVNNYVISHDIILVLSRDVFAQALPTASSCIQKLKTAHRLPHSQASPPTNPPNNGLMSRRSYDSFAHEKRLSKYRVTDDELFKSVDSYDL
jgi:hypothetical protein